MASRLVQATVSTSIALMMLTQPSLSDSRTTDGRIYTADTAHASNWHPLNVISMIGNVSVRPNWIDGDDCFWYRYRTNDNIKYMYADPTKGTKVPLFDNETLASRLQNAVDSGINHASLNLDELSVKEQGKIIEFSLKGSRYRYYNSDSTLSEIEQQTNNSQPEEWQNSSPDGSKSVFVIGNNLFIIDSHDTLKTETQLTHDGLYSYSWGSDWDLIQNDDTTHYYVDATWSPDSRKVAIFRADLRSVGEVQVVDYLSELRAKIKTLKYPLPCEAVPVWELWIYDLDRSEIKKIDISRWKDQVLTDLTCETTYWSSDSRTYYFIRKSRDHHSVDVCTVDIDSWHCRTVIEERLGCQVFIHPLVEIPENGDLLWWSMRDGFGHYYRYSREGELINQVTSGRINALEIASIDGKNEFLYFLAGKDEEDVNPYLNYLYRVNLDGSELTVVTPEEANHSCELSPTKNYFVDNYSEVAKPTVSVLRDSHGRVILELESVDVSELEQAGWRPPVVFKAKAADGVTDLWGVMELPYNLDTTKKYPVITQVYPGRQTEGLAFDFWPVDLKAYLAQYGFIVVQFGNRGGSPHRGLDYWTYGREDFRDYGLEDKRVVIEQLAEKYDFIDIERVGIFGGSSGGFMTVSSMLVYPDFFDVGVAMTAPNDPGRMYNLWFERYKGFVKNTGEANSDILECDIPTNLELAENLKGHLLMIYGGKDELVHMTQLFSMADAFIKAGKHFDMFVIPDADHSLGDWEYKYSLICRYFIENLMGDKSVGIDLLVQ